MNNSTNEILSAIQEARLDFNNNPFNWTASEANTRSKLFELLQKHIKGEIYINDEYPKPHFENQESSRIHLEFNLKKGIRPDIIIYKNAEIFYCKNDYKDFEKIECFIEIKATWGYHPLHFTGKGVQKDLHNLTLYPEKEYFVYFIANNFKNMSNDHKHEYSNELKKYLHLKHRIYIVFRDLINPNELFK